MAYRLYVLANSVKFILLKDFTWAATVGQGGRRSHGGYLDHAGCSVHCLGSLYYRESGDQRTAATPKPNLENNE